MEIVEKDPNAILDYGFDWTDWMASTDTITASTWTASHTGITITASSYSDYTTTVWLSGGSVGRRYTITNHIHTDDGRQENRSFMVIVRSK